MSDTIIQVENLSKKYILGHQQEGSSSYKSLRETIANGVGSLFKGRSEARAAQEEFWALKDVSFEIKQGDRVGIIGRNGAGKSTLLKVLSRITEPTNGSIRIKGRVASLLEVGTGFHPELTGRENIFLNGAILGMSKVEITRKFDEIVAFAEVEKFLDTPVKRYSSGMYVRLAFAVAAHLEPEILIVDEVLAVGDAQFQKKCLSKMEDVGKEGRTVLFVSHNIGAISSLCNQGVYLQQGQVKCVGLVDDVVHDYMMALYKGNSYPAGVLYKNDKVDHSKFQVAEVSVLDKKNHLLPIIKTWDYLRIRVRYYAPRPVVFGAVVLEILTFTGNKLIEYSTQPLSGLELPISEGESFIDCIIPRLPLAAGSYRLNVGLAVPMVEWLYWEEDLATIEVTEADVYQSNFPPNQERTPVVVEHYWETSQNEISCQTHPYTHS